MKSKIWLLFIVFIFISGVAQAQEKKTITATNNQECYPANTTFIIPKGKIATDFKIISLDNGYNCHTHAKLNRNEVGFSISKGGFYKTIYRYVKGTDISKLQLDAGKYYLIVDGGIRAKAVITYTLKP